MGSKGIASSFGALFLELNLFFLAMVSSTYVPEEVPSQKKGTCPIDTLKLGVCAKVLNLVRVKVGSPPTLPCCHLIKGLPDVEAAACLCATLKANVLGTNLNIPVSLGLILNNCGRSNSGFECPT